MGKKEQQRKVVVPFSGTAKINYSSFNVQALLLIIIGLIFYSNTFLNEYALDDGIVIQKNEYVQQGFRGIPKILTADAYESFYKQMNAGQQLSGGRYRPLSIVTFAIEQQLFGSKEKMPPLNDIATIRHVANVALYIFSVIVLLFFLREYIFKENALAAFITCLLFLIHPIHTEVVANVKSRDELFSFLFIILTFIAAFRYRENKSNQNLFYGLLFYFLALLSKEYAITLLVLIPMLFYIVKVDKLEQSIITTLPFMALALVYLVIRYKIVGVGSSIEDPDVLNSPYKFATATQEWATKIELLNHYLKLLIYPTPLSSDYSYNTIPYLNFTNIRVWLAILIHLALIVLTIILFFKRNIIAFGLAFYLLHLFLISNLFMDIGATMGERLIYHSSFGFLLIIALYISWGLQKINNVTTKNAVGIFLGVLLIFWFGKITIARNFDWKNDTTLFIADAKTVPNSALVNGNAGKGYIDLSEKPENKLRENELIQKAIYHLNRAIEIHPKYVNGYLNLGVAYFKLKEYENANQYWDKAKFIYPNNPFLKKNYTLLASVYFNEAMNIGKEQPLVAIRFLEKAVAIDSLNADYWYNIGGANFTIKNYDSARKAWEKTLQLKPDYIQAQQGMAALPK
ncbi:MAG: tetratricopeptide repeat protein [Bacteroidia bacterium]